MKRSFKIALCASAASLVLGTAIALQIGLRANHVEHDLVQLKQNVQTQEHLRQEFYASVQTRQELLKSLRTQGFPFPRIMDSVSTAIAEKAGLTSVALDGTGRLIVNGDATNEKDVIKTLENLRRIPFFDSVSMDMFDKQTPTVNSGWLVRFQISCQLTAARTTASAAPTDRRER